MTVLLSMWLVAILARAACLPRALSWWNKLPFFAAFALATITQSTILFYLAIYDPKSYPATQRTFLPYVFTVQVCAAVEAFWWIASALPNFRKAGLWLMGACVAVAIVVARPQAGSLQDMEKSCGLALMLFIGVTLGVHKILIGTQSKSAMAHGAALAALSLSTYMNWLMVRTNPTVALGMMTAIQVWQAIWWLRAVRQQPNWVPPEPALDGPTFEETAEQLRRAGENARAFSGR